jgi:hypothetical protein
MLDVEPLIRDELARLSPFDGTERGRWETVLERARDARRPGRERRRRTLVAAAVGLAAVVIVAVAVAAGSGGFRGWLTGAPGRPASTAAKAAFERATRSWRGFPPSTQLRQLVVARVDGVRYELDGFRGAGSLCVRLVANGAATTTRLECAPLAELRAVDVPALVLGVDSSFGSAGSEATYGPFTLMRPKAAVTFGVLADHVDHVAIIHRTPTPTRVFVSGDAFLAVSPGQSPFDTTIRIVASAGGRSAAVPFAQAATLVNPPTSSGPRPAGPTNVDRTLTSGAISWFARRQPRGVAVPRNLHHIVGASPEAIFARMITPDPAAPERLVVSISPAGKRYFGGRLRNNREVCAELVGGRYEGGDCWPAGRLFSTGPVATAVIIQQGGQVGVVTGLAADSVASLRAFPAVGPPRSVAVNDNGFFLAATARDFPLRVVAYDAAGRIVGNKVLLGTAAPAGAQRAPAPAPGAVWRRVLTNRAGTVYTIRSTSGGVCTAFKAIGSTGAGMECGDTLPPRGLSVGVGTERGHSFVAGLAGAEIRQLRITLRNGHVVSIRGIRGYVFVRLAGTTRVGRIEGLDAHGRTVVTERYP